MSWHKKISLFLTHGGQHSKELRYCSLIKEQVDIFIFRGTYRVDVGNYESTVEASYTEIWRIRNLRAKE